MNHPTNDELLLLAYEELPPDAATAIESHVTNCATCQAQVVALGQARVALDVTLTPRRSAVTRWLPLALAAAAVLLGVLLSRSVPSRGEGRGWNPTTEWSATAGYVAGGKAMVDIDAQLTRLEQERYYGLPD